MTDISTCSTIQRGTHVGQALMKFVIMTPSSAKSHKAVIGYRIGTKLNFALHNGY